MAVVVLFVSIPAFSTASFSITQENLEDIEDVIEEKIYCNVRVEDDFTDDKIIVIFNKNESRKLISYTSNDFIEIDCLNVKGLTDLTLKRLQKTENANIIKKENFRNIVCIELSEKSKENVIECIKILEKREDVLYVGPNYRYYPCATPNDAYYTQQWGLPQINTTNAWNLTTGLYDVRVGIMDTGVYNHSDLYANMVSGYNFVDYSYNTNDTHGHGTHVAGIVGAAQNNNIGITGVSGKVTIIPLKISDNGDGTETDRLIAAINYATESGIKIINFSWGGLNYDWAFEYAIKSFSGLFICAAGNSGRNIDNCGCCADCTNDRLCECTCSNHFVPCICKSSFPTKFNLSNMIVVGASNESDTTWNGWPPHNASNYGSASVDLFAPGESILSTYPTNLCLSGDCIYDSKTIHYQNGYHYASGTSMAAPHVAGVAALILSIRPDLSPLDVKECIMQGVDQIPALSGYCVTGGRLNAYKALQNAMSGVIRLKNGSGLYLDATAGRPEQENGSFKTAGQISQLWDIVPSSVSGYFEILPVINRNLRLTASTMSNGADCTFASRGATGSATLNLQLWRFDLCDNDYYRITPKNDSTKCLEIENGNISPKAGRVAQVWTYSSTVAAMKWTIEKQKPIPDPSYSESSPYVYPSNCGSYYGMYLSSSTGANPGSRIPKVDYGGDTWILKYSCGYYTISSEYMPNYKLYIYSPSAGYTVVYAGVTGTSYTNVLVDKWLILEASDDGYWIVPVLSPFDSIGTYGSGPGSQLILEECDDTNDWNKWYI